MIHGVVGFKGVETEKSLAYSAVEEVSALIIYYGEGRGSVAVVEERLRACCGQFRTVNAQ
jgi:hypothetical protein